MNTVSLAMIESRDLSRKDIAKYKAKVHVYIYEGKYEKPSLMTYSDM